MSCSELISGSRQNGAHHQELGNREILKEAAAFMTCENQPPELSGLTNNAQLFAGYDPKGGFRIFFMEERNTVLEEVSDIYLAEGSGTITCDLAFSGFSATHSLRSRRDGLDRVKTLITMLEGVEEAHTLVAGVGGYPKIMYFDGSQTRPEDRYWELSDCRSHLASEIVSAGANELLTGETVYQLIDALIFQHRPFREVFAAFRDQSPAELDRFQRGYPSPPVTSDHFPGGGR